MLHPRSMDSNSASEITPSLSVSCCCMITLISSSVTLLPSFVNAFLMFRASIELLSSTSNDLNMAATLALVKYLLTSIVAAMNSV